MRTFVAQPRALSPRRRPRAPCRSALKGAAAVGKAAEKGVRTFCMPYSRSIIAHPFREGRSKCSRRSDACSWAHVPLFSAKNVAQKVFILSYRPPQPSPINRRHATLSTYIAKAAPRDGGKMQQKRAQHPPDHGVLRDTPKKAAAGKTSKPKPQRQQIIFHRSERVDNTPGVFSPFV